MDSGSALFSPVSQAGFSPMEILALIGIAAGVFLFFRGFRLLQYKRLLLDTPFSKVRSASIGLVEVSGTAAGPLTIPAGITGDPCFYYCAQAWQLRESGNRREWHLVAQESLFVPFFVQDMTGRLLVDPQGAELNIHETFQDEIGSSFLNKGDLVPEKVRQFLLRHGIGSCEPLRLKEKCIKPGYPLFVFGTLGEHQELSSWEAAPHVAGLPPWSRSGGSSLSAVLQGKGNSAFPTMAPAGIPVSALLSAAQAAPASLSAENANEPLRRTSAQVPANPRVAPSPLSKVNTDVSSANLWTQGDFDQNPRVSIGKGSRSDPFLLSYESQREVAQSLAWKSAGLICGGPALALSSLYLLLSYLESF